MMIKTNKPIVSILIANYNNRNLLNRCIQSCLKQNYKNYEIIIYDDCSTDGSNLELKKYNNIKIILNKNKKNIPYIDAMNAYFEMFKVSRGEFIFFLDSDDYFYPKKISTVSKLFLSDQKINFIQNFPKNIHYSKSSPISRWPSFYPTSCLSVRRNFFKEFINFEKKLKKKYLNVWMDFRLSAFAFFKTNNLFTTSKSLTYYEQNLLGNQSKKFPKYSYSWFLRRFYSHLYVNEIIGRKYKFSLDYILTNIICKILKKF